MRLSIGDMFVGDLDRRMMMFDSIDDARWLGKGEEKKEMFRLKIGFLTHDGGDSG